MPSSDAPKLYLNEHLSPRLSVQLRNHGFDVISSQATGMLSQTDEEQLALAASEQRNRYIQRRRLYAASRQVHH